MKYYEQDIIWYSPEQNRFYISKWHEGETFIDPKEGPLKLVCDFTDDFIVSDYYLIAYL